MDARALACVAARRQSTAIFNSKFISRFTSGAKLSFRTQPPNRLLAPIDNLCEAEREFDACRLLWLKVAGVAKWQTHRT